MVGDGAVGKTSAILSYMVNKIPEDYQPTVADSFSVDVTVDKENFTLEIFDTAGQEDFDRYLQFSLFILPKCTMVFRIRKQNIPVDTAVFLVCFSTVSQNSLENVKVCVKDLR